MKDQDSEVKRIARDGSFIVPHEALDGRELVKLAEGLALTHGGTEQWYAALDAAPTQSIIASMGALGGPHPQQGPRLHAFRDAARAMVEQKVAERTSAEMRRLERIGVRLAVVGIFVAVPSAVIAGLQLWKLFR